MKRRLARLALVVCCAVWSLGCPAVYPELDTKIRPLPEGAKLDPPPPGDLHWVAFRSAKIPEKTRDGRDWDQVLGSLPDVYAVVFVNEKELIRSPVARDTLTPDWSAGPRGNFQIGSDDRLRIELWEDNQLTDEPIGVRDLGKPLPEWDAAGQVRVSFDGGAEMILAWEPAHALFGLGLWFELRNDACYVTRLLDQSPASRAGVQKGDRVVRLGTRHVDQMSSDEVRSTFGAIPVSGVPVLLRHRDGSTTEAKLQEGPIYALYGQHGNLD